MKTIALFGGSFDPPHIGHERVVKALLDLKYIDKVVVMPTFLNPFKSSSHASASLRYRWLQEIFSDEARVEVSGYEMEQNKPITSIETVRHLLQKYKKIYLVIGADNLSSLERWDSFDELNTLVDFIVVTRDTIKIPPTFLTLDLDVDISSTSLRQNPTLSSLPKKCAKEIQNFYKANNAN